MEYYVSKNGSNLNCGSKEHPFLTISKAASLADEGDRVIVHEGVYRECVTISKGSAHKSSRIEYMAAEGEKVIIKGSEEVKNWEKYSENVYKAVVPNSIFGEYNPYSQIIDGDWYRTPVEYRIHTGQVYINGVSLREVGSLEEVVCNNWYAQVKDTETEIYANFGDLLPNENVVEINVRQSCIKAASAGIDYITVSGFEVCHAATQWSPPTAEQTGAICANMCKGWIIENNHVHNSRCSGICVGKDRSTGQNRASRFYKKTGHLSQLEVVFAAVNAGWSKETVGSHIIRNNLVHDCGQAGIMGHLGCAFSEVYGNHIYNIQHTEEFFGHEIAGIKFHGGIDTYIHHNCVHNSRIGVWMDWQAQGSRISSNLFFNNTGVFVEVTHGPHTIDNNIMISEVALHVRSQGGAFINNLIAGILETAAQPRFTPYHVAHSTRIKGVVANSVGDDRFYNNIFAGRDDDWENPDYRYYGTYGYNGNTTSAEEYTGICSEIMIDFPRTDIKLPAYINNNSYISGAKPFEGEENNAVCPQLTDVTVTEENGVLYLEFDMPEEAFVKGTEIMTTDNLARTIFAEESFENADATKMIIDKDYFGEQRSNTPTVGPFENLKPGKNRIAVWNL